MGLIDADAPREKMQALFEHHNEMSNYAACGAVEDCLEFLDSAPTVYTEPVRHGYWIEENGIQICSECGEEHDWDEYRAPYCETCGAKMDGGAELT